MTTTYLDFSTRSYVRFPLPGPISKTVSSLFIPAQFTIS